MTCDTMLVAMLDADADELAGEASTPLAEHVRSCAKCGAVARRLLHETGALARGLSYRPIPDLGAFKAARPRPVVVVAASVMSLAAAILVFVAVRYSMEARIKAGPMGAGTMTANAVQALPSDVKQHASRDNALASYQIHAHEIAPARYVASAPVAATAYPAPTVAVVTDAPPDAEAVVVVDPPEGRRAAVMHGRNRSITVVWLY
jgi:hypothetical protein